MTFPQRCGKLHEEETPHIEKAAIFRGPDQNAQPRVLRLADLFDGCGKNELNFGSFAAAPSSRRELAAHIRVQSGLTCIRSGLTCVSRPVRFGFRRTHTHSVFLGGPGAFIMDMVIVSLSGEFRQGEELRLVPEEIPFPAAVIEPEKDIVYRVGKKLFGAKKDDYLVIELRTRVHTAELVVVSVKERLYVGRWWAKHGKRELQDERGNVLLVAPKIVGVVNQIVRM